GDVAAVGGVAEDVADDEHQQRADPATLSRREDFSPRALVHQAVGQHDDFPRIVLDRPGQHLLFRIVGPGLRDADVAYLALFLELHEGRREHVAMVVVGRRIDGVEMEDVDVVEAEPLQSRLDAARYLLGRAARAEKGLGRDHQLVPVIGPDRGADDLLGAVGLGGVEEIYAEIDGRADHRHALIDAGAAAATEPAVAAAAEAGDADPEAGVSERLV